MGVKEIVMTIKGNITLFMIGLNTNLGREKGRCTTGGQKIMIVVIGTQRVLVHERLRFPQEQSAKQGRTEGLDELANRRELIPESDSQWCPRGLTRSQKRRVQRLRQKE
jgi:hypothetical protein